MFPTTVTDERAQAEAALAQYGSDEEGEIEWPPAARRIREARERLGLSQSAVAAQLALQDSEYWDVEFHDDEVFTNFAVDELVRLARIVRTPLHELLFGPGYEPPTERCSWASIARRLTALAATEGLTTDELGDQIGWELEDIFADPESLGTLTVAGLCDVCKAVGVDWATALPL